MPAVLTVLRFTTGQPERSRWYLGNSEPPQLGRRYSIPLPSVLLGEPAHWALKPTNRVYKTVPLFWGLTGPTKNPMAHCLQYIIQNAFLGKPAHRANETSTGPLYKMVFWETCSLGKPTDRVYKTVPLWTRRASTSRARARLVAAEVQHRQQQPRDGQAVCQRQALEATFAPGRVDAETG